VGCKEFKGQQFITRFFRYLRSFMMSTSKWFKFCSLVVLAAMGLTMVARPTFRSQAQDDVSGTLDVLGFSLPDEIATVRVDQFTAAYPDVEVNFTEGALDEQQFLTSVASGEPPDLVYMTRDVLSTYAVRGALVPLSECIESQGIDMSQFREAAVSQVTIDGEVYGIPEFFNVILMIGNSAALEEAGVTPENFNTTDWDAVAAMNDAMTRMDGDTLNRIGFDPKLPEFLPLWAAANGASLISEDGRTAQLNDPAVVEALEFAAGLHEAAGGRQDFMAFRDTWDFFGSANQMASDQLGAFPMEQWYVNVLAGASPDAPVAFAPFTDRNGEPITFATGNAWAIPRGSGNEAAACAFVKTVTSPEAWIAAATERAALRAESGEPNTGVYTANSVADETIFGEIVQPTGNEAFDSGIQTILTVMDHAFSIPANPAGSEFRQAWMDAADRVLNGEQTAQEALDQAQEEAQEALDEAWEEQED
jgi:multiple sugar transport system substrate-binding protein